MGSFTLSPMFVHILEGSLKYVAKKFYNIGHLLLEDK